MSNERKGIELKLRRIKPPNHQGEVATRLGSAQEVAW